MAERVSSKVVTGTEREQAVRDFLAAYDSLESDAVQLCREVLRIQQTQAWRDFPAFTQKGTGSIVVEFLRFLKPQTTADTAQAWVRQGNVIAALEPAAGRVSLDLLRNQHQLRALAPVLTDYDESAVGEVWAKAVEIAATENVVPNRAIIARARALTGNVPLRPVRAPRTYSDEDADQDYAKAREAINRILTHPSPEPWLERFAAWFTATTTAAGY